MFPVYFSVLCFGLYILLKKRHIKKIGLDWTVGIAMTIISTAFAAYCICYIPIKDFTAYAIGNNINEKMNDGVPGEFATQVIYTNIKTGKDKTFELMDPEWQDTTQWKWKETISTEIKRGRIASISSFNPEGDYENLTEAEKNNPIFKATIDQNISQYYLRYIAINSLQYGYTDTIDPMDYSVETYPDSAWKILARGDKLLDANKRFSVNHQQYLISVPNVILFAMLQTDKAYKGSMNKIKDLIEKANQNSVPVYILTASGKPEIAKLEKEFKLNAKYLTIDETELKIIVRSNPGMIMLKKGVVSGKWPGRSLPNWEDVKEIL
jgi:hypothetical protein